MAGILAITATGVNCRADERSKLIDPINAFAVRADDNQTGPNANRQTRPAVMQHPRLYQRVRPQGRISSGAKLLFEPKAAPIECILVDYSTGGACLQLPKFIELPDRFEVLRHHKEALSPRLEARLPHRRRVLV